MTPAHVCLFTDSLEPSGVGEHMLTLAAELRSRYRVSLVCPPGVGGDPILARAERLGLLAAPLAIDRPEARQHFAHWLRSHDVTIFHGHAGVGWEGHDGVFAARSTHIPAVIRTEHLPYLITDSGQRADHREVMAAVDRLLVVSHAARRTFIDAGICPGKVCAVQNGIRIRPPRLSGATVREELGLGRDARLVLSIGRFTEQKGHRYLMDALPIVNRSVPGVLLLLVGTGPLEDELRRRTEENRCSAAVRFVGRRDDIPELLAQSDLFVLPSLFEGLPLILLEAMALGRPVVATDVCGSSEVVDDGRTGRLVPACSPAQLASAIIEGLTQPDRASAWGIAGRLRFERQFTAQRMAHETAGIYEELLRRSSERQNACRVTVAA